jgi:hypothetical protein
MFRLFSLLLFSLGISLGFGCDFVRDPGAVSNVSRISEDELAVFSTVLKDLPANQSTIMDKSAYEVFGASSDDMQEILPGLEAETLGDFASKNAKKVPLVEGISIRPGYPLVDRQAIDPASRHYAFSRVGFSHDKKQALIYFFDACPLCDRGAFYLLTNRDGSWVIVGESETFRS